MSSRLTMNLNRPASSTTATLSRWLAFICSRTVRAESLCRATSTDETARLERWLRCSFHTLLEQRLPLPALELLLAWKYPHVRSYFASRTESTLVRGELEKLASYTRPQEFDGQIE